MITVCSIKTFGLRIQVLLFALPLSDTRKPARMTFLQWQYLYSQHSFIQKLFCSLRVMPPSRCMKLVLNLINSNLNLIVRLPISLFKMSYSFASYCSSLLKSSQYPLPKRFYYSLVHFLRCYLFVPSPVLLPSSPSSYTALYIFH